MRTLASMYPQHLGPRYDIEHRDLNLDDPIELAQIFRKLEITPLEISIPTLVEILRKPLDLSGVVSNHAFYRALRGPKQDLLEYLQSPAQLDHIKSLKGYPPLYDNCNQRLALSYTMGGLSALECLLRVEGMEASIGKKNFLHWAISTGDSQLMSHLLTLSKLISDYMEESREEEYYPAYLAAEQGHLDILKLLLDDSRFMAGMMVDPSVPLQSAIGNADLEILDYLMSLPLIKQAVLTDYSDGRGTWANKCYQEPPESVLECAINPPNADLERMGSKHLIMVQYFLDIPEIVIDACENPDGVLQAAGACGDLTILEHLLTIAEIQAHESNSHQALIYAAANGHLAMVIYLLDAKTADFNIPKEAMMLGAAECGHIHLVNHLLSMSGYEAPLIAGAASTDLLKQVARNGYIDVLNRLLEIKAISQLPITLDWAVDVNPYDPLEEIRLVINRSLELPQARQTLTKKYPSYIHELIIHGSKRALWLDLQKSNDFSNIRSFAELHEFAVKFLNQQPDWINTNEPSLSRTKLLSGLKIQILSLRYYGYLNYVQFEPSAPNKQLGEHLFGQSWLNHFHQYIELLDNLLHFEADGSIKQVAIQCLKQWTAENSARRQAKLHSLTTQSTDGFRDPKRQRL